MGKFKKAAKGKRFGHKASAPVLSLDNQILDAKFAKPSIRVKGRDKRKDASANKKYCNLAGMLSQNRQLENEEYMDQPQDEVLPSQLEELDDVLLPQNIDAIVKDFEKEMNINMSEEEKIFASLMHSSDDQTKKKSFAAQVKETLLEKQTEIQTQIDDESVAAGDPNLNPEVQEMCAATGELLRTYRSGPIPKILKAIPMMRNWQHLLYHTCPDKWSAAAMYQMTRVFCSQRPDVVQVFYNKILLPRCRDDISHYKRLNAHLFGALRKAMFKPAAFFRGIILPLCLSRDCTLREAIIFGTVIQRKSIPMLVSAAALIKMSEMEYSGANSIFIRILLNKKYSLSWTVIDAICSHFVSFKLEVRSLPVLWHQSLLTFVERYKEQLSEDQKKQLYGLAAFHPHKLITPEVRRELENSVCRGPSKPARKTTTGKVW